MWGALSGMQGRVQSICQHKEKMKKKETKKHWGAIGGDRDRNVIATMVLMFLMVIMKGHSHKSQTNAEKKSVESLSVRR